MHLEILGAKPKEVV